MNPELLIPEVASPEVQAFLTGFPTTLLHAGVTVLILALGATLYALLTPHKEITHIREGNAAAAVAFGGVLVGLAIPLAVSLTEISAAVLLVAAKLAAALILAAAVAG